MPPPKYVPFEAMTVRKRPERVSPSTVTTIGCGIIPAGGQLHYFQLGAYIEHVPTGLWGLFDYGHLDDNFSVATVNATNTYYFKAGLRERWHPLGHTVLYGEYLQSDDAKVGGTIATAAFDDNKLQVWGLGVVQEIDAAAMSVWLSYRHLSYDDSTLASYDDFKYVKFGGLINF